MLATQVESHDRDIKTDNFNPILTKSELSRITESGDYIIDNITEKISVVTLSRHLRISPKKIQAGIRFLYGCSANEYMNKLRLEQAKELMYSTDNTISEICYSVGYQSRSYFSKIFSANYGMLPNVYRKSIQEENLLFEMSYRSIAIDSISPTDLGNIVEKAREMNSNHAITGSLIYYKKIFFQILEGPKEQVIQIYENISKDKRHNDVQIMWKGYRVLKGSSRIGH